VLPILRKARNSVPSDGRSIDAVTAGLMTSAGTERPGRATDARRPAARLELLDLGMVLLRKSVF
jgi:hypothetical protein